MTEFFENSQLQFAQVLTQVASYAKSPEARNLLLQAQPLTKPAAVTHLLDETEEGTRLLERSLQLPFVSSDSLLPLINRAQKGLLLSADDLEKVADYLRVCELLQRFLYREKDLVPILNSYSEELQLFPKLVEQIYQSIEHSQVADSADRDLRRLRRQEQELSQEIKDTAGKLLQSKKVSQSLQEQRLVEKDGHLTLPVKSSFKKAIAGRIIAYSANGQTAFILPRKLDQLSSEKIAVKGQIEAIEAMILGQLTAAVYEESPGLLRNIDVVAAIDQIMARARYSRELNGKRARLNQTNQLLLRGMRHPLLRNPVPLDLEIKPPVRGLIITGPNAGGKTATLKNCGLAIMMTEIGLFLPSREICDIPVSQQIFSQIGDQQDLDNSLSTFSAEMTNIAKIVTHAQSRSLVLLDELGSGTDPDEGAAIAISVLQALQLKGCLVLATTHYSRIKDYAVKHPNYRTASMDFNADTLTPTYRLLLDQVGQSRAFWIAQKVGMPKEIIAQAQKVLAGQLPLSSSTVVLKEKATGKIAKTHFCKGDVVYAGNLEKEGIFYALEANRTLAKIFINKQFSVVPVKRLKLRRKAADLYPEGYNLDLLFISDWQEYKFNKDLNRGSKKAYKKLVKHEQEVKGNSSKNS